MKGFFPLIIEAVRGLSNASLSTLTIIATCDEESSMSGARALVDAGYNLGQAAIIGEPTGLKPIRLHKGVMMEKLEILIADIAPIQTMGGVLGPCTMPSAL